MNLEGKKLGILVTTKPESASFNHALNLSEAALARGLQVYFYCLDQSVEGLSDARLQKLKNSGLKLFACALGAHKRKIPLSDQATFGGLGVMSDVITCTDRFVTFS
jgi:hypothetical protein